MMIGNPIRLLIDGLFRESCLNVPVALELSQSGSPCLQFFGGRVHARLVFNTAPTYYHFRDHSEPPALSNS